MVTKEQVAAISKAYYAAKKYKGKRLERELHKISKQAGIEKEFKKYHRPKRHHHTPSKRTTTPTPPPPSDQQTQSATKEQLEQVLREQAPKPKPKPEIDETAGGEILYYPLENVMVKRTWRTEPAKALVMVEEPTTAVGKTFSFLEKETLGRVRGERKKRVHPAVETPKEMVAHSAYVVGETAIGLGAAAWEIGKALNPRDPHPEIFLNIPAALRSWGERTGQRLRTDPSMVVAEAATLWAFGRGAGAAARWAKTKHLAPKTVSVTKTQTIREPLTPTQDIYIHKTDITTATGGKTIKSQAAAVSLAEDIGKKTYHVTVGGVQTGEKISLYAGKGTTMPSPHFKDYFYTQEVIKIKPQAGIYRPTKTFGYSGISVKTGETIEGALKKTYFGEVGALADKKAATAYAGTSAVWERVKTQPTWPDYGVTSFTKKTLGGSKTAAEKVIEKTAEQQAIKTVVEQTTPKTLPIVAPSGATNLTAAPKEKMLTKTIITEETKILGTKPKTKLSVKPAPKQVVLLKPTPAVRHTPKVKGGGGVSVAEMPAEALETKTALETKPALETKTAQKTVSTTRTATMPTATTPPPIAIPRTYPTTAATRLAMPRARVGGLGFKVFFKKRGRIEKSRYPAFKFKQEALRFGAVASLKTKSITGFTVRKRPVFGIERLRKRLPLFGKLRKSFVGRGGWLEEKPPQARKPRKKRKTRWTP